jgi:tRNA A-37 threonylcarbamoyl transferase component Bud32
MYLKNFLFDTDRTIYTLDGDGIRPVSRLFARSQALQNLAVLLSKFDVMDETAWLPQLLESYSKERNRDSGINLQHMRKHIATHRRRVVHGYADSKVFRQCSDVQVEKSWKSFTAISRQYVDAALKNALADPDQLLNDKTSKRLKSGNTCTVGLVKAGGRKIVVKRYNIKNTWHALGRMFRPSRAAVSWSNAHRLQMYGIATASPLLVKEERFGPLRFRAWLLAEYIDAPDVADWMDENSDAAKQKLAAANLAKLLYKMRLLQIAHGDLKASNIHVVDAHPVLIDLDSMHEYSCRKIFEYRHIRDLRRFLRNWQAKTEIHALMVNALKMVYGDDPILARAGI